MKTLAGVVAMAAVVISAGAVKAEQRAYEVPSFDTVKVTTGISAVIAVGDAQAISAEAPNTAALDRLHVAVKDGVLELGIGDNLVGRLLTLGQQPSILVQVSAPALKAVEASAGANVDIAGMKGDAVSLAASSGAAMVAKLGGAAAVNLDVSSGGNLKVSGACAHLIANVSSGGNLDARDLACEEVNATASAGGHGVVNATGSINAHATIGCSLEVVGKPGKVESDAGMGGSVKIAD
jgi:hypothetical protein